jgi:hypothetical protein
VTVHSAQIKTASAQVVSTVEEDRRTTPSEGSYFSGSGFESLAAHQTSRSQAWGFRISRSLAHLWHALRLRLSSCGIGRTVLDLALFVLFSDLLRPAERALKAAAGGTLRAYGEHLPSGTPGIRFAAPVGRAALRAVLQPCPNLRAHL